MLEWPLRVLLVVGGFVLATPGGGIVPFSQWQMTALGLAMLVPTLLFALLLVRRGKLPEPAQAPAGPERVRQTGAPLA